MLRTLSERYTERVIPISRRDTLDDVAQMFKSNTESSITSIGMGGTGSLRPYQEHAWVHACVKAIAKNVAQVPFKLRTKGANENLADSHELVKLFAGPNPLTSRFELWEGTESHLQLGGNAWWAAVPGSLEGRIAEIWVLSKKEVKPDIIAGVFRGWKVDWKGYKDYFSPGELIHFRYFNPYHPIMGMAPLEAARMSIDQDYWANRYNEAFFQNFAEPGVVLTAPGRLSPDQRKVMLATWEDRHRGFNRARKTALLEGGTTIHDIGVNKRDMQFIEQKKLTRNEILSIFRVPPVEVMLVELVSSQVESQRAQRMLFGEEVIAPELAYIEDRLAAGFFAVHAPDVEGYFDTSEVSILQKSFEDKLKQARQLWEMGYPINHINQKLELGFEDLAWGDVAWVPQTLVPITALMGITEPPASKTPAATPPAKTLPPIAAPPSGVEPDAIATHAPPAADAAAAASTEQVPAPAQVTRAAAAGGQDLGMIPPVVRREACVAQAWPGILAESCRAPAAELDRKLQRYFFTLRNKVLRCGELDNIAYEGARLIDIAQPILQAVAMEVLDCEREAVRLSHQIAARFQETLPLIQANVRRDTTAVKHLFSLLKREAGRLARNAVAQTYQSAQELLVRGMVLEWEEPEELNFDQYWRDYIVNVDRQERRYHKALLRWTDELQREYMTAFYGSRSILTRVGEPTLDWQAQTDKLAAASAGPVGEATEQGGQCKLLLPATTPEEPGLDPNEVFKNREAMLKTAAMLDEVMGTEGGQNLIFGTASRMLKATRSYESYKPGVAPSIYAEHGHAEYGIFLSRMSPATAERFLSHIETSEHPAVRAAVTNSLAWYGPGKVSDVAATRSDYQGLKNRAGSFEGARQAFVDQWTLAGGTPGSVNAQLAARTMGANEGKLTYIHGGSYPVDKPEPSPEVTATLQQMYGDTQEYYKKKKVTEVTLYRGTIGATITHQPLESWSDDIAQARKFARKAPKGKGVIMKTTVRIEDVFGTYKSIPNWPEKEVIGKREFIVFGSAVKVSATYRPDEVVEP